MLSPTKLAWSASHLLLVRGPYNLRSNQHPHEMTVPADCAQGQRNARSLWTLHGCFHCRRIWCQTPQPPNDFVAKIFVSKFYGCPHQILLRPNKCELNMPSMVHKYPYYVWWWLPHTALSNTQWIRICLWWFPAHSSWGRICKALDYRRGTNISHPCSNATWVYHLPDPN